MSEFYIRFGVHKDRQVIKDMREVISGLVIPAHIFSYSAKATTVAIMYVNKPFFVDPMTYIFTDENIRDYTTIDSKTNKKKFKPSITKLTEDYELTTHFVNNDFSPLTPSDFDEVSFLKAFCKNNLKLQNEKAENEKGNTIKKYLKLLSESGTQTTDYMSNEVHPEFITAPYFYIKSLTDPWLEVNHKLAAETKTLTTKKVVPIVLTNTNCLSTALLDKYSDFDNLIIWINDLREKETNDKVNMATYKASLKKYALFIQEATKRGVGVTNLYGSYYSILLSKLGLKGMCNGVFYGEHKAFKSNVGGVPPCRYYFRKIHDFATIPEAIALLGMDKYKTLLDTESKECMELINGNPSKIALFEKDHAKAQQTFIFSRKNELDDADKYDLKQLIAKLSDSYTDYFPLPSHITKKGLHYLTAWKEVLQDFIS